MSEKELKVVKMYKEREKVNKICADLDITMGMLYRILRKHKVKLRSDR